MPKMALKRIPILSRQLPATRFPPFLPEDNDSTGPDSMQEIACANEDLKELLELDYENFYSRILYDKMLMKFVDSFLMHKSRAFDDCIKVDNSRQKSLSSKSAFRSEILGLSRRVLLVLHRVLFDPARTQYYGNSQYGESLYDNWIFDIPKMMDVSALYGGNNPELIRKMWSQLLKLQPKYKSDFEGALVDTCGALSSLKSKAKAERGLSEAEADDMLCYLRDLISTFLGTIQVFDAATDVIVSRKQKQENMVQALYECYVDTLPAIQEFCVDMDLWMEACGLLLLLVCHLLHKHLNLDSIQSNQDQLSSTLNSLLKESKSGTTNCPEFVAAVLLAYKYWRHSQLSHLEIAEAAIGTKKKLAETHADMQTPKDREMRPLIEQVQQVLPDIGEGFIAAILIANQNDVQKSISCLLDNNIPAVARNIPRKISFAEFTKKYSKSAKMKGSGKSKNARKNKAKNATSFLIGEAPKQWIGKKPLVFDKINPKSRRSRGYDMYEDEYDDGYDAPVALSFERQNSLDVLGVESDEAEDDQSLVFSNPNRATRGNTTVEAVLRASDQTDEQLATQRERQRDRISDKILMLQGKLAALNRHDSEYLSKRTFFKEQIAITKNKLKNLETANTNLRTQKASNNVSRRADQQRGRNNERNNKRSRGRGTNSARGRGNGQHNAKSRSRRRKTKNKGKVGNHNRVAGRMKKTGGT